MIRRSKTDFLSARERRCAVRLNKRGARQAGRAQPRAAADAPQSQAAKDVCFPCGLFEYAMGGSQLRKDSLSAVRGLGLVEILLCHSPAGRSLDSFISTGFNFM